MCRLTSDSLRRSSRRAVTLIELMIAIAILALMTAALGALTYTVNVASDYNDGISGAAQHSRVALERIGMAVSDGFANESFPCAVVFPEVIGTYNYPDTLVVWSPAGLPVDPVGLPRFNEIVVFAPNPSTPNELLEITSPLDTRTVPAVADTALWAAELSNLKTGTSSQKVLVTDLLRTAAPSITSTPRGVVRFSVELHPTVADLAGFHAGTTTFEDLPWVQTIRGLQAGLCQTNVRSELQMTPGYLVPANQAAYTALGFFGSATLYWNLRP